MFRYAYVNYLNLYKASNYLNNASNNETSKVILFNCIVLVVREHFSIWKDDTLRAVFCAAVTTLFASSGLSKRSFALCNNGWSFLIFSRMEFAD